DSKSPGTDLLGSADEQAENPASGQVSNPPHRPTGRDLGASAPLYDCVHDAVVEWLRARGIAARKWSRECDAEPTAGAASMPAQAAAPHRTAAATHGADMQRRFLCFERRSCGDVVWQDHKVMGSAQRRGAGALLQ